MASWGSTTANVATIVTATVAVIPILIAHMHSIALTGGVDCLASPR